MEINLSDASCFCSGIHWLIKFVIILLIFATVSFIYLFIKTLPVVFRLKRQWNPWREQGKYPMQPPFISDTEWADMIPLQWVNLPLWEHYWNFCTQPLGNIARKAKIFMRISLLAGLAGTIYQLMTVFFMGGITGSGGLGAISVGSSCAFYFIFDATLLAIFLYALIAWIELIISRGQECLHDAMKKVNVTIISAESSQ